MRTTKYIHKGEHNEIVFKMCHYVLVNSLAIKKNICQKAYFMSQVLIQNIGFIYIYIHIYTTRDSLTPYITTQLLREIHRNI